MKTSLWKLAGVGALCLALGIAGTAGAGALITGKNVKDGSIGLKDLSAKAKKALKGARGPAGPTGPTGAAGQNGAPGGPGTSGSTAPALMLGSVAIDAGGTLFATPGGGPQANSESGTQVPVPPGASLVARDFAARASVAPGAGQSFAIALRLNGADTGLSCTIAGGAVSTCAAPGTTVLDLPSGGLLSVRVIASAGAASAKVSWGFRIVF